MVVVSFAIVTVFLPPRAAERAEHPIGGLYRVNGVTVNPAGTRGAPLLRVEAALESPDASVLKELAERDTQIRDILITELSARGLNQLLDPQGKEELRRRIVERINRELVRGSLSNLYFTQFVVQ
jgi:flagellar FliL protein